MEEKKGISRRTALKMMGSAALAVVMASSEAVALTSCMGARRKRVMLYFSATGNSLYVARQLAGKEGEMLSIPQLMRKQELEIEADEIGIVYPVYGHMPPYMVRQFIKKARLKSDYLFAVLTYGNRKCSAVEIWNDIAKKAGYKFDYITTLIMVDNWLPNFDMNEQVKIDKHIPENLKKIAADVDAHKQWHEEVTQEEREKHKAFLERTGIDPEVGFLMRSEKYFTATDDCIDCGVCTYVCPRGNYELTGRGVRIEGDCEFCLACIQNCPQKAIHFIEQEEGTWPDGKEVNPKARYRNENVSLMELKMANNQRI